MTGQGGVSHPSTRSRDCGRTPVSSSLPVIKVGDGGVAVAQAARKSLSLCPEKVDALHISSLSMFESLNLNFAADRTYIYVYTDTKAWSSRMRMLHLSSPSLSAFSASVVFYALINKHMEYEGRASSIWILLILINFTPKRRLAFLQQCPQGNLCRHVQIYCVATALLLACLWQAGTARCMTAHSFSLLAALPQL